MRRSSTMPIDIDKQAKSLWLERRPPLRTYADAKKFMMSVGIALRYWSTPSLPLASMYQAATGMGGKDAGQRKAIDLTNQLLGRYEVVEVNVIAGRISLIAVSLMPALYRLVTRSRLDDANTPWLSSEAKLTLKIVRQNGQVTAGDVRKCLGVRSGLQDDPAYRALGELQQCLLVDRGPFRSPDKGIPYLSKEGYPYRLFHEAHLDLVTQSAELTLGSAADNFLLTYLRGAIFSSEKKMIAMFKIFLSPAEIHESLERLKKQKKISLENAKGGVVALFIAS